MKKYKQWKNCNNKDNANLKKGAVKALFDREVIPFVHGLY